MTAVEWLMDKLPKSIETQFSKQIEQAKKMEKQQIIDAWNDGLYGALRKGEDNAEQYYNETFKK